MLRKHCLIPLLLLFFIYCQTWPSTMAEFNGFQAGKNYTWQKAFEVLGISWNPDGTLNREIQIPMVNATPTVTDPNSPPKALSTDVRLSYKNKAYVRLYIPVNPPKNKKLPLIVNFHGGDFVLFSVKTIIFHELCEDMAAALPAVVVSVEHRLAPENRLPAAYDDALQAIFWLKNQALGTEGRDPWLEYADFKKVFLFGSGAGGNIVYHAGLASLDFNLQPIKISGIMMNQPFFGGIIPTPSEIRLIDDESVPLYVCNTLWTLALPRRANRDHEFCNPMSGGSYGGRVRRLPPVFVKGDEGDPLVDRATRLVKLLRSYRVPVYYMHGEGARHGIELSNKTAAQELFNAMNYFISSVKITITAEDGESRASF